MQVWVGMMGMVVVWVVVVGRGLGRGRGRGETVTFASLRPFQLVPEPGALPLDHVQQVPQLVLGRAKGKVRLHRGPAGILGP